MPRPRASTAKNFAARISLANNLMVGRGADNERANMVAARSTARRLVAYVRDADPDIQAELPSLREHFQLISSVEDVREGDLVLCRFSQHPFAEGLEAEVGRRGGRVLNGGSSRAYLEDLRCWYPDFADLTPRSWFSVEEVDSPGPFFVKGRNNSRKSDWGLCYADDRERLKELASVLQRDPLIGSQGICVRQFVPLHGWGKDPRTGTPISEEYRFLVAGGRVLAGGFYWQRHLPALNRRGIHPDAGVVPAVQIQELARRLQHKAEYAAVDVARAEDGKWILIEIGNASMAGLAGADTRALYGSLRELYGCG